MLSSTQKAPPIRLQFKLSSYAIPPKDRKNYLEVEGKMMEQDRQILKQKELSSNLEAYSYEMRGNIEQNGTLEKYIDPSIKDSFIASLNSVVDWIYEGEGKHASAPELEQKLRDLKSIGDPIKNRQYYFSELDIYFT